MEKKLYPLKFVPIASRRPWGGSYLVKELGKEFTELGEDGTEKAIGADELIGESWEVADMGEQDSPIANGYLAGNTIGDVMETYMERVVGEKVFERYGTQFPLLIKFLDINDKLSVQSHPNDEVAAQRYDSLGKEEVWYVMDAKPGAKVYMGFKEDTPSQDFYNACKNGTADKLLNVIEPKKGDVIWIKPGTVHAADGGLQICEIQESSDLTFRLYDWGRELDPKTARKTHLEEAFDLINFSKFNEEDYIPAAKIPAKNETNAYCFADCPRFTVSKVTLHDGMHIYTDQLESFVIYCCIKGEVSLQMADENGVTKDYRIKRGETILVPAECPDFILSPVELGSELIESVVHPE
ncbi:MAG: class I mannose-6-phosphate isomerase [Bacteroidales bacterium]|nr:class I mannose-6-phosphate isomerase [Bacteroidales bacterium]